jgi:hypothetical protein
LGHGTAIISLNGQRLLIHNFLHVPGLWIPLYSLQAHLCQSGCGFLGSYETGMRVYFPGVVLTVDTSSDCHLSYQPLGKTVALSSLHYVQPWCPPVVYPTERSALLALPHPSSDSLLPSDSQRGWFFCRFLFSTMSVLNSLRLVAFPALSFLLLCHGRKGGGCCHVSLPRGMSRQQPTGMLLGPL